MEKRPEAVRKREPFSCGCLGEKLYFILQKMPEKHLVRKPYLICQTMSEGLHVVIKLHWIDSPLAVNHPEKSCFIGVQALTGPLHQFQHRCV